MVPIIPTKMSDGCRREVTEPSEGLRLIAYRDCVGVLTIGFGHTSTAGAPAVVPGMKITREQADEILSRDLAVFERGVAALLAKAKAPVLRHEFDALVDLAFNIGLKAFAGSSLLKAYLAGDKMLAATKFLDWNRAGGKVVAGLTNRRRRERAWFLTGTLAMTTVAFLGACDAPEDNIHDHAQIDSPDLPLDLEVRGLIGWGLIAILLLAAGAAAGVHFVR